MRFATIIVLALGLLSIGASTAVAKPKVAVLGIEVTGTIDQASTGVAHDLTEGLRTKAKAGNGPFQLAPNADRELIDEKVLKNCDSEGPLCMSDIGKDIGADVLIYGKLEKTGDGYVARLHVLDVKKKSHEKQIVVQVPGGQSGDAVRTFAKKAYVDLVGAGAPVATASTLVVKVNADTGTVFVDDEQKESIVEGSATLTLPEGRYRIAVESPGKRRKEKVVMISAGESATEEFALVAVDTGGGGGKKSNIWKPVFGISLAAAAVLGGISLYSFIDWKGKVGDIKATYKDGRDAAVGDGDCDGSGVSSAVDDTGGTLASVCGPRWRNITTGIAFGGVAVFTGFAAYMAFVRGGDTESTSASAGRPVRPRSQIAVTPLLTPTTQGALLQFSW